MKYKNLGRTGLFVSEICLGTMTFGGRGELWPIIGQLDQAMATNLLRLSIDAGVNFFDTADVYSEGEAERILGRAIKDLGLARKDVIIATKVRGRTGPGPNAVGLSRAYPGCGQGQSCAARYGLYRSVPNSRHRPRDAARRNAARARRCRAGRPGPLHWLLEPHGLADHEGARPLCQPRMGALRNRTSLLFDCRQDIEREIVPLIAEERLGLMVWSPLAGGLLSGKFRRDFAGPNDARRTRFDFPPVEREHAYRIVDVIRPIAERHDVSVARVALAWLLHQNNVMSVIVGAKTAEQLADNIAATELTLSKEVFAALATASAPMLEYPSWMVDRQNAGRAPEPYQSGRKRVTGS
jgi:aryl-alcohol dehydrogenase-like predicted oxidoreductase